MILRKKLRSSVLVMVGDTAPTDGTSGTGNGLAGPGSFYVRTVGQIGLFLNTGTKLSPAWVPATKTVTAVASGSNGAGQITATGFKVGDKVVAAVNLTDGTNDAANFEAVITVVDKIVQSSASN